MPPTAQLRQAAAALPLPRRSLTIPLSQLPRSLQLSQLLSPTPLSRRPRSRRNNNQESISNRAPLACNSRRGFFSDNLSQNRSKFCPQICARDFWFVNALASLKLQPQKPQRQSAKHCYKRNALPSAVSGHSYTAGDGAPFYYGHDSKYPIEGLANRRLKWQHLYRTISFSLGPDKRRWSRGAQIP